MTSEEEELLETVLAMFEENSVMLSSWEMSFMTDTKARYDKYKGDTYLSGKQWAVVKKIAAKLEVEC